MTIWWLLAVPVPFLVAALLAVRGGLRDDETWWREHRSTCPLEAHRP